MTACQIARHKLPATCQPLLGETTHDPRRDIEACLDSLVLGSSNMWTTYEGNKFNALFMCSIMRSDMDKQNQLQNMRKMFEAVVGIGTILKNHTAVMEELKKAYDEKVAAGDFQTAGMMGMGLVVFDKRSKFDKKDNGKFGKIKATSFEEYVVQHPDAKIV